MCGIAGFVGPWSDHLLQEMLNALRHRGPDGRGSWRDPAGSVALGHLRLSIIDLNTAANQPMHSADGRYTISFNGEIYNYRSLRSEAEAAGVTFRTQSDTEVLLNCFAREGEACLDRLQGIFAFAVWDRVTRRLFLARDHIGVKPLYYASLPKGFLFASELKGLVVCPDVSRELDPSVVLNHIGFLWSSSDGTMLKSVCKLRPGHCAWVTEDGRLSVKRYYTVPLPSAQAERRSAQPAELLSLFDRVVSDQMVADVPIGACLSGGVDSSAVVASMCRATDPSRILTFCASVPKDNRQADNFGDDITYAREMAAALNVPLIEVPVDAGVLDELPNMLWDLDEPTADVSALLTRRIAAEARQHGIKVLLSGTGADDLFTGYGRHTAAYAWAMLDRLPGTRAAAAAMLCRLPTTSLLGRRLARLGQLLALDEEAMLTEVMSFSSWPPDQRLGLLTQAFREMPGESCPDPFRLVFERSRGCHPVDRVLQLDLDGFVPDLNLNYADKMAMQEGIELRVPFLDTRLVSFAMDVSFRQKITLRETKKIFRDSVRSRVTDGVLTRPKQGFGVPVRAWLAGPGRDLMNDMTTPAALTKRQLFDPAAVARLRAEFEAQRGDVAYTLFSVMAVELWCDALDAHPTLSPVAAPASGNGAQEAATVQVA